MSKVLITGGNRGIGKAIAIELVTQGHNVVILCRKKEESKKVILEIKANQPHAKITDIQGDLSLMSNCYQIANQIKAQHPDINVLINNAGVWMTDKKLNRDGIEMSFMINYLAPLILCQELKATLVKNSPSRIINVNAGLYVKGQFNADKTPYGLDFSPIRTYASSKLCGAMFVIDFSKELSGTGVTINAVHPGVIRTGLGDSNKLVSKFIGLIKRLWKSPEYGALSPVWLSVSNDIEGVNGSYFNEKKKIEYSEQANNPEIRKRLRLKTFELLQNYQSRS